jgi:broad specificity phosphatase PhoE
VLFLVRHGRTAHNADGRLLGRLDVPLDDLGRRQAAALGQVPALRGASRVISSPLTRAIDTASRLGPPVEVDARWAEIDYGDLDGVALGDAGKLFEEWERDLGYVPPGGESILDLGERVRGACESIWDEAASSDVVVVSHVSPIKAAVAWTLGVTDETCWRMYLDVASVSVIGAGRRGPSLRSYNEVHHRPSQ